MQDFIEYKLILLLEGYSKFVHICRKKQEFCLFERLDLSQFKSKTYQI